MFLVSREYIDVARVCIIGGRTPFVQRDTSEISFGATFPRPANRVTKRQDFLLPYRPPSYSGSIMRRKDYEAKECVSYTGTQEVCRFQTRGRNKPVEK